MAGDGELPNRLGFHSWYNHVVIVEFSVAWYFSPFPPGTDPVISIVPGFPSASLNWLDISWPPGAGTHLIEMVLSVSNPVGWDGGLFVIEEVPSLTIGQDPTELLIDLATVEKLISIPYGKISPSTTRYRRSYVAFYLESYPEARAKLQQIKAALQNLLTAIAISNEPGSFAIAGSVDLVAENPADLEP